MLRAGLLPIFFIAAWVCNSVTASPPETRPDPTALKACQIKSAKYNIEKQYVDACALRDAWKQRSKSLAENFQATECTVDEDNNRINCDDRNACKGILPYTQDRAIITQKMSYPCSNSGCKAASHVGCCNMCAQLQLRKQDLRWEPESNPDDVHIYDVECIGCSKEELNQIVKDNPKCYRENTGYFECIEEEQCQIGDPTKSKEEDYFQCKITPCGTSGCDDHSVAECCRLCLETMCSGMSELDRVWCQGCDKIPSADVASASGTLSTGHCLLCVILPLCAAVAGADLLASSV